MFYREQNATMPVVLSALKRKTGLGKSGPNLEPVTMRVCVTNGRRNGLNIGTRVGPCPGSLRRWVLGSVHAVSQAAHAANTYPSQV